jgi:hypothetical protein
MQCRAGGGKWPMVPTSRPHSQEPCPEVASTSPPPTTPPPPIHPPRAAAAPPSATPPRPWAAACCGVGNVGVWVGGWVGEWVCGWVSGDLRQRRNQLLLAGPPFRPGAQFHPTTQGSLAPPTPNSTPANPPGPPPPGRRAGKARRQLQPHGYTSCTLIYIIKWVENGAAGPPGQRAGEARRQLQRARVALPHPALHLAASGARAGRDRDVVWSGLNPSLGWSHMAPTSAPPGGERCRVGWGWGPSVGAESGPGREQCTGRGCGKVVGLPFPIPKLEVYATGA